MLEKISSLNISSKVQTGLKNLCSRPFLGKIKLNQLARDTVELSDSAKAPEILKEKPGIVIGKFDSGIKDDRLKNFWTEYRAYNFEGYGDRYPNNYICIDTKGERRLKPHIYLNMVEVKPDFARQGVYSKALKSLIEASKKEGCEGRITLDSLKVSYAETKIPSPSIAHWKNGFRFADPENNKIMQKVLKGELPLDQAPEGSMYLEIK